MFFSVILEQRAITVVHVVSHPDTLKHGVARRFVLFQSEYHSKLGLYVILRHVLKPPEIPLAIDTL